MAKEIVVPKSGLDEVLKAIELAAQAKKKALDDASQQKKDAEMAERNIWKPWAAHQIPPEDNDWLTWLIMTGRRHPAKQKQVHVMLMSMRVIIQMLELA